MNSYFCPECGSENIFYSKKRMIYVCEDCNCTFQPVSAKKQKIFFSYGHDENEVVVEKFKQSLEECGYDVWIDRSEIKAGNDWRNAITEGIISSGVMVVFLSRHSVRSPGVCLDEIRIGLSHTKGNIQTILLESEEEVSVPSSISDIQWLDMSTWKNNFKEPSIWESWYTSKFKELCDILEDPLRNGFQGEIQRIQNMLNPIESDSREKMLLSKQFVGRAWLESEMEDWRGGNTGSRSFIIYAPPGVGKSSFAAHQLHFNCHILCGVFCEWNKPDFSNPKNIIRLIAYKLATKLPDYRKLLIKRIENFGENRLLSLTPSDMFDQILSQPLSDLIDGGRERMLVIIDGIDEADDLGTQNALAVALSSNMDKLPQWLSLVITCRPESNITPFFKAYNPKIIEPTGIDNSLDIKQFLDLNLSEQSADVSQKRTAIQSILANCQGSFLYASLIVDTVRTSGFSALSADRLPNGLEAFYYQDFLKKFKTPNQYAKIRGMLEILAAFQDMPQSLLCKITEISLYDLLGLVKQLGSLLVLTTVSTSLYAKIPTYRFHHKSIVDWLTNYEIAAQFFIDINQGLDKALNYFSDNFKEEITSVDDVEQQYIQTHIIDCYVRLNQWDGLEKFLLKPDTPLYPYWNALSYFPKNYSTTALINYLKDHENSLDFFTLLQRNGEQALAANIIGRMIEQSGIKNLSTDVFTIYADILHIGGKYKKAAELYDNFIAAQCSEDILKNPKLFYIAIRRIHHRMFFCPVDDLIQEALLLMRHIDNLMVFDEYNKLNNELLFLIGGNLGVLSGDFPFAEMWIKKSFDFSKKINNHDFEIRTIRKTLDLLCHKKQYKEALDLSEKYFKYDGNLNSRYHIYLLGALGEIYRHLEMYEKSEICYNRLLDITDRRGLKGWKCHALLALALLEFSKEDMHTAKRFLSQAQKTYEQLEQCWGIISSKTLAFQISLSEGDLSSELPTEIQRLKQEANQLKYRYNESILGELEQTGKISDYHLFFL